MTGSVFIEPNTFSILKVDVVIANGKEMLRSVMPSSVVDCIKVNIDFFGAHFHQ